MKIKSNASPDELSSPYYEMNENFCRAFESYIATKNGKVRGSYNAWSYFAQGKIEAKRKWNITYKKSVFTSSGNLFMSSKKQSLLVLAEWKTNIPGTRSSNFVLRRRRRSDFFRKQIDRSIYVLDYRKQYTLETTIGQPELAFKILKLLTPLLHSGEIYRIEHLEHELNVELRSELHHFDLLDSLIADL